MKKNTRITLKGLLLVLIFSLPFSFNSCKDDDFPNYVGTWERTVNTELGNGMQTLKITESSFVMNMAVNIASSWIDFMIVKGTLSKEGDIFHLTVTEVGLLNDNLTAIEYFTPDDENWLQILTEEVDVPETFEAKFVISGNTLTLITDDNEDGTFDPIEEGEVFTRK